jgi:hypothetical protein
MKRVLSLAFVVVMAVALVGCSVFFTPSRNEQGEVTASAIAGVFNIKVGDCMGKVATDNVTLQLLIPCTDEHYWEAFMARELPDDDFPGDTEIEEQAYYLCTANFDSFVGIDYRESKYEVFYFYPIEQSWAKGDREILCFVGLESGGVTGSLAGAEK